MNRITQIILLLALLLPATAYAHDFVVNGIYYNINGNEATVTSCPFPNKYSGSVTIPATVTYNGTTYSVTTIGLQAFSDCIGLTSITLPNSVTEIGPQAFLRCTGLTSVTIPNSVTTIGIGAFYLCTGLTSITLPNSVTEIGPQAFCSCSGLTSVTIPNSVTTIGNEAFRDCTGLTRVNISDIAAWCNIEFLSIYSNPLYYCGHLYMSGSEITELTIPNSVTNIKQLAFYCCSGLTNVTIGNSVTSIGLNAFANCSGLTNVTIPNSVTEIGPQAFLRCTGLTSIDIPNSVTTIEGAAFHGCTSLTNVTIGNSVTTIGDYAFNGCNSLSEIYSYPVAPPTLSQYSFSDYGASLYVHKSAKNAYSNAAYWKNFTSVYSIESIEPIEPIEFADSAVEAICLANWDLNGDGKLGYNEAEVVTSLGDVFKGDSTITSFDELQYFTGLTSIGSFENCINLKSIVLPDSITNVSINLKNCSSFHYLRIPRSVTSISFSYENCPLDLEIESGNTQYMSENGGVYKIYTNSTGRLLWYVNNSCTSFIVDTCVYRIAENAFWNAKNLEYVKFEGSNSPNQYSEHYVSIGYYNNDLNTFKNCPLKEVELNRYIRRRIEDSIYDNYDVFQNNKTLEKVTLGSNVTSFYDNMFDGCSNLSTVVAESEITYVGVHAFRGTKWAEINSENGVTYLGNYAATYDGKSVDITFKDNTSGIAKGFFSGVKGLGTVELPSSNISIPNLMFYWAEAEEVIIPKDITRISYNSFTYAKVLKLVIEEGENELQIDSNHDDPCGAFDSSNIGTAILSRPLIEHNSIGSDWNRQYAHPFGASAIDTVIITRDLDISDWFNGCEINIVEFPQDLTSIGDYAFKYQNDSYNYYYRTTYSLKSITIPSSVTNIGNQAFYKNFNLTSVTCLATVPPSIVSSSFADRYDYITLYVPAGCKAIYEATDIWKDFHEIIELAPTDIIEVDSIYYQINEGNVVTVVSRGEGNNPYSGDIVIPDCIDYNGVRYIVTSIGEHAFSNCSGLTSIDIPNSVTTIGRSAFSNCSGLTNITIPNSVTTIGGYAFEGCSGVTSISIGSSITYIDFSEWGIDNSRLTNITVDSGNSYYDSRNGCNAIIETSNNTLIYGCMNTVIPNSVTSIGYGAFFGCSGLTSITIPNSVIDIGSYAFFCCSGLTSVTIGNSVTTIGYGAFGGCSSLTSITIPSSVTYISSFAFSDCTALKTLNYNAISCDLGIIVFPYNISTLNIGDSVQKIPAGFAYGFSLENITIPNSVTEIGEHAFSICSLTSITIPNSVTTIGDAAFENCSNMDKVYSYILDPTLITMGEDVFILSSENYDERILYVPFGSSALYHADNRWSQYFGSIVEMEPEDILATSVELDCESVELTEGETLQLTATVLPEDATVKTVTWTSSDEAVATVDQNGLVTALATGTAIITATTNDGSELSATCVVNVTSPAMPPTVENQFVVTNISAKHGDVVVIPVALINSQTFAAFQTDVFLPEGFSIVTDEDDEYLVTPSERLTSDHVLMTNDANNGSVRVLCYTPNALPIDGSEGELFYITVQVPDNVEGTYTIALRNSLLTTTEYQEISIPDAEGQMEIYAFIPGDVNDSRTVTVTDIVVTAQYVLDRNPSPFIFEAADMNGDGNVTVTDIMLIANLINHPTMTAPKRMPILDGSNDYMSGEDLTLMAGETRKVSIQLNNEMDYTAFQLDLTLPAGLTANNFQLTDRAGNHAFDVNAIGGNKLRALCYSPAIKVINGHEGALLTFDVTANATVEGDITVDGIELVTTDCQTVLLNGFAIGVNTTTSVNEVANGKTVARVDYFNLAGQRIDRPESGVTLVVTTYTDGTRTTTKLIQ